MRDYSVKFATAYWIPSNGDPKGIKGLGLFDTDSMSQNLIIDKFLGRLHRNGGAILFNGRKKAKPIKKLDRKTKRMVKRGLYSKDALAFANPLWIPEPAQIHKTKHPLKMKLCKLGYLRRMSLRGPYGILVWLEKRTVKIRAVPRIRREEETSIAI